MSSRRKLAFYIRDLISIGGVGTWFYYVLPDLRKYHDVTLFYEIADPKQLERLEAAGVKVERLVNQPKTTFDMLFRGYDKVPNIKAKYVIHTLHSCVSEHDNLFNVAGKIDRFLAVSQSAKDSFREAYPKDKRPIDVVTNYVPVQKVPGTKPIKGRLTMVMASRLTKEKGLLHLIKMLKDFDQRQLEYQIDIFTFFPKIPHLDPRRVKFHQPRLDIDFSKYHYLVQLSDTEAYCYTVHEALSVGTAVIVQDLPVFRGVVKHGYNGYIYPDTADITDVPVRFDYKPTGSVKEWLKYIDNVLK
jgi:glycosyltransferase involved in cell wall biosynthesis